MGMKYYDLESWNMVVEILALCMAYTQRNDEGLYGEAEAIRPQGGAINNVCIIFWLEVSEGRYNTRDRVTWWGFNESRIMKWL